MTEREPFDRVAQGRRDIEKRWVKYRADRVARGLPATKAEESGRKPAFIADPEVQAFWFEKAESLGLLDDLNRTDARRVAKRLADDATAELARRVESDGPATPPLCDDDLLLAFYEAEATRWRARAIRDRQVAAQHDELAADAETALAALLHKFGRIK
ncbi:hypothetical protein [Mycetocola sp.]|uniref:hypothetical protein n=1 Tax=Mycetocola sp. TaxID=1871042 RepID=UPI00398998FC